MLVAGAIGINSASLMVRYNRLSSSAWLAEATRMEAEVRRLTAGSHPVDSPWMMPPHVFPANDVNAFLSALLERLPPTPGKGLACTTPATMIAGRSNG
jgi:Zn-dependent protease with chaperone function